MYVPAENVYYEAFVQGEHRPGEEDLWSELLSRRVFPLSPNTFTLYLATLQIGLRGLRVEEGARRIVALLSSLSGDLAAFRESFDLTGKQLLNASRNLEDARRKLEEVEWKLGRVESLGEARTGVELDK